MVPPGSMTRDPISKPRASYDAVAEPYAASFSDELAGKPLERGLLDTIAELSTLLGGPIADVGCGPGHVTRYLAERGAHAFGIDLSPAMVALARARQAGLDFSVGSMTALEAKDGEWAAAVALYSIIHLDAADRAAAYAELARVIRPGGWLLMSFHVSTAEKPAGAEVHLETWFDAAVDLTAFFIDPEEASAGLRAAGFEIRARLDREPWVSSEYPSRRCYLLARRTP
jgi:SAM-dependent methyltransferase